MSDNEGIRILVTGGSGFIGTHFVELIRKDSVIENVDIAKPKISDHDIFWKNCDVKDFNKLCEIFAAFKPSHVLHLAAKANLVGKSISEFQDNTIGTKNVIECIKHTNSVERFILTSTQFVVRPGEYPQSDDYLKPYTAYGESKAETERHLRDSDCDVCWTIIRPTNIWGPWHTAFPKEMWPYIERGLYFHPGYQPILKFYGYVENITNQILCLFMASEEKVHGKVFYVTDPPIDNAEWMNTFSMALRGKPIIRIPRTIWRFLACVGDVAKRFNMPSPIASDRYFRLTVSENLPYERTLEISGPPIVSLKEGVERSVTWFRKYTQDIIKE